MLVVRGARVSLCITRRPISSQFTGSDMTQATISIDPPKAVQTASSSCGGTGSDATLDNAHVAEDYLARTTTTYRIIAVGRTCSVP
jgi:hypothetical protein